MTPEDKQLARDWLQSGRLTIDQVAQLSAECDATGRSLSEAAAARGWLPDTKVPGTFVSPSDTKVPRALVSREKASAPIPRPFMVLLGALLVVLIAGVIVGYLRLKAGWERDVEMAEETSRFQAQAERQAQEAKRVYQRRLFDERAAKAAQGLREARTAMAWVEERVGAAPDSPDLYVRAVEATLGFNAYLELHPGDAAVYVERARAFELRRNYDKAVDDLERAISLKRELEASLRDKIIQLKLLLPRK